VIVSRRRRSAAVSASLAAAFSLAVTGCSGSRPDYRGVCTDRSTGTRVDDARCRDGSPGHAWYYYGRGVRYPALGQRVSGGTFSAPRGASVAAGGASAKGGTVAKGVFGSSSRGGGIGG
jgi:hypothetical protein